MMIPDVDMIRRLLALAELVPILESDDADFGHWEVIPPDGGVHHLPYYTFGPAGEAFRSAVGRGDWIISGFDWRTWLQTDEGRSLRDRHAAVAAAGPDQIARLVTAIVRSDRFVEGSIAGAYESGLLTGIARRAAALAADLEPNPT